MKPKKIEITQNRLKELIHYNPYAGVVTNLIARGNIPSGKELGTLSPKQGRMSTSYKIICLDKKGYPLHRIICYYMLGDDFNQDLIIDHIDGNGINNKWENLRIVSDSVNCKNQKTRICNTSGVSGVNWYENSKKWQARIVNDNKKRISLGHFKNFFEAVCARKSAELKYGYIVR